MCDTIYAGPVTSSEGNAWFAKNSDRHPLEPQTLCIVPLREVSKTTIVGRRSFQFEDKGFSFVLSKPAWMDGGEMGINEKGLAIGNEAVFSRFKPARDGFLGMDLLRAVLASTAGAKEAVERICEFSSTNDQGGNAAFKGRLYYDNSYIVADSNEAFVVETAGRRWAWRQVEAIAAISNAYSIEDEYRRLDTQTRKEIAPVNEKAACSDEADPGRKGSKESWRGHVEKKWPLWFSRGDTRRTASLSALAAASGTMSLSAIFGIMRSHGSFDPKRQHSRNMESLCIHAGGFPLATATTASMVVEYLGKKGNTGSDSANATIWFTGGSYPCLSLYKPIILKEGTFSALWTDYDYSENSKKALAYWERQRVWIKKAKAATFALDVDFTAKRDAAQARIVSAASAAIAGAAEDKARAEIDAAVSEWYGSLDGWNRIIAG